MPSEVVFLVNPVSGRGRGERAARVAAECVEAAGFTVRQLVGQDPDDAAQLARKAAADDPVALVVVGGDGMVHLTLPALAGTTVPLGVVPTGTGNDLARTVGVPLGNPRRAADALATALAEDQTREIDLVQAGGELFVTALASGFDSRVADRVNRMRWPRGRLRYDIATFAELGVFKPIPYMVTCDGEELRTDAMLVAVGNGPSYGGGIPICPAAEPDDGLLDVFIAGPVSKLELIRMFTKVKRGEHLDHPAATLKRARTVTLSAPEVTAYADGDVLGPLPVTCEVVPRALRVLAPRGT